MPETDPEAGIDPAPPEGHGRAGIREGERGRRQPPSPRPQTPAPPGAAGQVPPGPLWARLLAAGMIDWSLAANRTALALPGRGRGRGGVWPAPGSGRYLRRGSGPAEAGAGWSSRLAVSACARGASPLAECPANADRGR